MGDGDLKKVGMSIQMFIDASSNTKNKPFLT